MLFFVRDVSLKIIDLLSYKETFSIFFDKNNRFNDIPFKKNQNYRFLKIILPFVRSYGLISTVTLSPVKILI